MHPQVIAPGVRLGPYEVVSRLGAGGMGEVWIARDTRLDRRVAVKVLPAELANNAQFRLRFDREAKTISQLSHPHICTLFDVGDDFLVMELLDGETLAERIARGPMPLADVLRFGAQIAEALANAHRAGIVHRDLKPANVMLTKSGAKLLDFGLAKPNTGVVDVDGATQHKALTQEGTILGTFQYMAPEQLEGQEADARTDIFALGALLYEMVTGQRAFQGKTRTSLIAAIVTAQPAPISRFQPITPPAFEHVVTRCLSKEPDDRWQSAQDIAGELRWIAAGTGTESSKGGNRKLPWIVTAGVLIAALAGIAFLVSRTPQPRVLWTDIAPPPGVRLLSPLDRGGSAISPDGNRVVFVGQEASGAPRLYLRDLSNGDARPINGTEGAVYPFWSPDSRTIAFFADGKMKRIDADGTRAAIIADEVDGRGGTWGPDGTIVFAPSSGSPLARVRAAGGKPELFTKFGPDAGSHRFPSFLPDGKHVLFMALGGSQARGIHIASLDGARQRQLTGTSLSGVYCDGFVVYLHEGALLAQRLDIDKLQLRDEPIRIASGVSGKQTTFGNSGLSITRSGEILFPGPFETKSEVVWRNRSGVVLRQFAADRIYDEPALSPDETRVAAVGDESLWEIDERGRSRLLVESAYVSAPTWSADGRRIVFTGSYEGKKGVLAVPASGGKPEVLLMASQTLFTEALTPDGLSLVLNGPVDREQLDLLSLGLADRRIKPFVSGPGHQVRAQFSPDGRFFVYSSDETGRPELFLQRYPPTGAKWQVTFNGGDQAFWRSDGKELMYLAPDGKMMSIAVTLGETPAFSDPVALFSTSLNLVSMTGSRSQYVVTRDGQRFMLIETAQTAPRHHTLITNFPQLLGER